MPAAANVKVLRDEKFIQEGEVRLTVPNLGEVKNAIAVLNKIRRQAIEEIGVDEEPDEGTSVLSVEYRVEGDTVVAHVTQGLVD